MLGVGIIGCGGISPKHIAAFRQCENAVVRAVASKTESSARHTGEALGVPYCTDYRELICRDDIDLVSICTPSGMHLEPALYAAEHGKHIIVEKPIEITTERIDRMIEACDRAHVVLSCIFNNRFSDAHAFVKQTADSGRFGKLINANVSIRWYRKPEYYLDSPWHGTLALDGGGALMNQGIHYVDLLQWLMGPVESVFAYTGTLLHRSIEAEDTAAACLRFQNGAIGTLLATTSTYPGYPAEIQLTGERGSAVITDGAITSWSFLDEDPLDENAALLMSKGSAKNNRAADPAAFSAENHYRQISRILNAIETGKPVDVDGREARKSVAVIEAVYRSAATHKQVSPV